MCAIFLFELISCSTIIKNYKFEKRELVRIYALTDNTSAVRRNATQMFVKKAKGRNVGCL